MCHEIFDLHFFHDSTPFGPLINRLKYFRIQFLRCAAHRWDKKTMFSINQNFMLQFFSFMIDVFTPKSISPDCLFKSNHRQVKNSILYPRRSLCARISRRNRKFENNLGCLSGAQMGLNHEKRGRNSRDTLPLRCK